MGRTKRYHLEEFVSVDENGVAKCLLCQKCIKPLVGNVKRHYESVHKKVFSPLDEDTDQPSSSKKSKLQMVPLKMDKSQFLRCVGKTVTEMHMPFSCYDNREFQNLLQPWSDGYGVKFNSKSIGEHINKMAATLRLEINRAVSNKYVCLKLDIASRMDRSIMGVNVQLINQNFEIVVYTIGMLELTERHYATYLKQKLLDTLDRFGIQISQVYSVTTDNGANVIKTSKLLQEYSENGIENDENVDDQVFDEVSKEMSVSLSEVHCAAHTLQLAAWDVIKKFSEKLTKCRDAIKIIRKKMRELNASPVPILDNTTRWSSTFEMMKSLSKAKVWIESNNVFTVSVDWEFVMKFEESFKPVADATIQLQSKQLVMGDFFREWMLCETELEEISNTNEIANLLLQALYKRKQVLVENKAFLAALYLDPRFCFRGSTYLSDDQKKVAISHLLTIYNKLKLFGEVNDFPPNEVTNESNLLPDVTVEERYQKLEQKAAASFLRRTDCTSVQECLDKLQYEEKLPFGTNILEFWKFKSFEKSILSKIAEVALAVPATQVSVERAFSALPVVMTKYRRNLSAEHLENILLVKLNSTLIDKLQIE